MKVTKDQLVKLLGRKISENLTKVILEQTKKDLELKLKEAEFDTDDFFFGDAEAAARADMQGHYGDSMVHANLGDKEDTRSFIQGQLDATEDDVDTHAPHLKAKYDTFNQKMVNFLTKDPELAHMREEDPRALLDTIGLAAYKYMMDHNSSSPFIAALQNWIVELDHQYEPSAEDLASVNMKAYQRLMKFEPIYNKSVERASLNEALSRLEERPIERHYSIVFQQGDDAMETMGILDQQGAEKAIEHLLQWYEGDGELQASEDGGPIRGTQDHEHRMVLDDGTYILNWNNHIPYIGLSKMKMVDVPEVDPHAYDDLYDNDVKLDELGAPSKTYTYNVNLDERGTFYADVRDENDNSVYEIKVGYGEEDNNPVDIGYMKHLRDIAGLESYLKELGIITSGSKIISAYSETVQEDVDDMDLDRGHLSDDPSSMESLATINDVEKGYFVVPPKGDDPLWYVVDQEGDPVQGYNSEEEAKAGVVGLESSFRPTGGLAPEDDERYGVDFKESRLARIDKLMNEALGLINEYRSMGGYPTGAEHDPRAPWNITEPKPAGRKPKEVFSLTDSNDECLIVHHGGSNYAFNMESLEPHQIESIAIDYVGVPSEVDRSEDGYSTAYDASNYRRAKDLPADAVVDYINANYAHMKLGEGPEAWEDGSYDLVRIDHPLAKELKATWSNLSVPLS